ncbi:GST C-terminal domain-containing protein [Plasmodiophora brassicae]
MAAMPATLEERSAQYHAWLETAPFARGTGRLEGHVVGGRSFRPGRYLLLAAAACPESHQALIVHKLKRLDGIVPVVLANTELTANGWTFPDGSPVPTSSLNDLYDRSMGAEGPYRGLMTLPALYDSQLKKIVNNHPVLILHMLARDFDFLLDDEARRASCADLCPRSMPMQCEAMLARLNRDVLSAIYAAGFAVNQDVYDRRVAELFQHLEQLEQALSKSRFLLGPDLTLPDIALFTILLRFELVYYSLFKCNLRPLSFFPKLTDLAKHVYQTEGVPGTVDCDVIKAHYYRSFASMNPSMVVAAGPDMAWLEAPCAATQLEHSPRRLD